MSLRNVASIDALDAPRITPPPYLVTKSDPLGRRAQGDQIADPIAQRILLPAKFSFTSKFDKAMFGKSRLSTPR